MKKINPVVVVPVLLSFFVVSFIDLVGTGVDELRQDSATPQYVLQLIPFVALIWFFLLSVPVGIWQDKAGKKRILNYGLLITALGLLVPLLGNTLPVILVAFSLLGIGNTILQVSANPLLVDVVPQERSSSYLSFSQFIKALGSMVGPFFAGIIGPWIARIVGDDSPGAWRYGLYLFALITLLSWLWIMLIRIEESHPDREPATLRSCFSLLGNNYVLLMVLGIFSAVGIDVAINSNIGTFLSEKLGVGEDAAKYAKSLYFLAKMVGTFAGALLLTRIAANKFLLGSSILLVLSLAALAFTSRETSAWINIFIVSLMASNIFPLIFSITVGRMPDRANEISGLMMMAISGGALIPFLAGYAMSQYVNGGILVLVVCALYLVIISLRSHK